MKLDVGCGVKPTGDVNIDLYTDRNLYRRGEGISSVIDTKKIPNFVLANASHLPFKDDCFDEVYSNSVLEHVDDYYGMLKEVWRVCRRNGQIFITTEHRLGGLFQVFRVFGRRNRGAITKQRFSRSFFLKTFGVTHIEDMRIKYELLGIPTGIEVLIQK